MPNRPAQFPPPPKANALTNTPDHEHKWRSRQRDGEHGKSSTQNRRPRWQVSRSRSLALSPGRAIESRRCRWSKRTQQEQDREQRRVPWQRERKLRRNSRGRIVRPRKPTVKLHGRNTWQLLGSRDNPETQTGGRKDHAISSARFSSRTCTRHGRHPASTCSPGS